MKYITLLVPFFAFQACATSATCGDRETQYEITRCAQKKLATLERKLQKKHEALSEYLEANDLEKASSAWKEYRDAHCSSTSNVYAGGSLHGYVLATCKTRATRRRLDVLDEDYQDALEIIKEGYP